MFKTSIMLHQAWVCDPLPGAIYAVGRQLMCLGLGAPRVLVIVGIWVKTIPRRSLAVDLTMI